MTPEQRFDRLERIVKLMITGGYRARNQIRDTKRDLSGMKKDLLCWLKLKPTAIGDWML